MTDDRETEMDHRRPYTPPIALPFLEYDLVRELRQLHDAERDLRRRVFLFCNRLCRQGDLRLVFHERLLAPNPIPRVTGVILSCLRKITIGGGKKARLLQSQRRRLKTSFVLAFKFAAY